MPQKGAKVTKQSLPALAQLKEALDSVVFEFNGVDQEFAGVSHSRQQIAFFHDAR